LQLHSADSLPTWSFGLEERPDTEQARLSYGQACALLDALHEFHHSALTHLAERGASLLLLMAESRRKEPEDLRCYFKPSDQALAGLPACWHTTAAAGLSSSGTGSSGSPLR
jgi:hypothetical protein